MKKSMLGLLCCFLLGNSFAQTPVSDRSSLISAKAPQTDSSLVVEYATDLELLIANFIESGVIVSNITYTGRPVSLGSFSQGEHTNLGLNNGIILSSGDVVDAIGPNNASNTTTNTGGGSDPDLVNLSGGNNIDDASILQFDLIPEGNVLAFNYVFGSEEYPEYANSLYNDVFGFFLTGPNPAGDAYDHSNIALIPGTELPVSINNINNGNSGNGPCENCEYYINNNGGLSIQYDGFTTVMPILVEVVPNQAYHLKIAVGDCADPMYDSGTFLQSPSLKSYIVTGVEEITPASDLSVFPNPVSGASVLTYNLYTEEMVTIRVFNLLGTEMATLTDGRRESGMHSVSLSSLSRKGVYVINFTTSSKSINLKVMVD